MKIRILILFLFHFLFYEIKQVKYIIIKTVHQTTVLVFTKSISKRIETFSVNKEMFTKYKKKHLEHLLKY